MEWTKCKPEGKRDAEYHGCASQRIRVGRRRHPKIGDSGIGRAVALAFAREGADLLVSYLDEHDDAGETRRLVEAAGHTCVVMPEGGALPGAG